MSTKVSKWTDKVGREAEKVRKRGRKLGLLEENQFDKVKKTVIPVD